MNESIAVSHSLNQAILAAMESHAERPCFFVQRDVQWRRVSYAQFRVRVLRLAAFFKENGLTHGDRVAIAADNSMEWMVVYTATILSGGVIVPLRVTLHPDTLRHILQETGARLAVLQQPEHLNVVASGMASDSPEQLFSLQSVLVAGESRDVPDDFVSLASVISIGLPPPPEAETDLLEGAADIQPRDLYSIFYVAGSSAQPRGAIFEHHQMSAQMELLAQVFPFKSGDVFFNFQVWSEAPSLALTVYCFLTGIPTVAISEDYEGMMAGLQQTSPTVIYGTPHVLEQFYESCMSWLSQQPESNQKVFEWALRKGRDYWSAGSEASPTLAQEYRRAELTFFNRLRAQLGGRLRLLYSTGASLSPQLVEFYEAIGIPALNLYSLAESGGFPAANRAESQRVGSAGQVTPGYEIRISKDSEILVRGETATRSYWRRPEETRQAFDDAGWLKTGDVGYLDEDGYLFITGRKEHRIVLSFGRKISPDPIQEMLRESPFISDGAVFGDNQPYVTALVLPDLEAISEHLGRDQPITDVDEPEVRALIEGVVSKINQDLDQWERICQFVLVPTEEVEDGGFGGQGRVALAQRFADKIATMYPTSHTLQMEEISQVQVDPERMRALLEKESILDAWMKDAGIEFLFDLARNKHIDVPSMIHICDAAATIAQTESEEKPLSTAFIVGEPAHIGTVLPESHIRLLYHDHIRRMRQVLVTMSEMVDGMVLGYVLDRYGYVRGIHRLTGLLPDTTSLLLGPHFRRHASISGQCNALVFFVPKGGKQVRVFANGDLVGRYAHGDWHPDNMARLDQSVSEMAKNGRYDHGLLRRILRCAFQMSENNQGAIFMLGDANRILHKSDASEISAYANILSSEVASMTDRELINFAKQDGATVIDNSGKFRGCMVLLRPDAETQAQVGPGKGSRHSSAAKMSKEAECLAVTVSQDGPITLYDCGRRLLSL